MNKREVDKAIGELEAAYSAEQSEDGMHAFEEQFAEEQFTERSPKWYDRPLYGIGSLALGALAVGVSSRIGLDSRLPYSGTQTTGDIVFGTIFFAGSTKLALKAIGEKTIQRIKSKIM